MDKYERNKIKTHWHQLKDTPNLNARTNRNEARTILVDLYQQLEPIIVESQGKRKYENTEYPTIRNF